MKYMGSKKKMLSKGLGNLLKKESKTATRIVDLFCGSAAVSWYAAINLNKPVCSVDLQHYSTVLAAAVSGRTESSDYEAIEHQWIETAEKAFQKFEQFDILGDYKNFCQKSVYDARILCENQLTVGPVWNAYGGFYFSPQQALSLDFLIRYLPDENHDLCLAAAVIAASKCAAAPGHTAQPFQPTETALPYIQEYWQKNIFGYVREALKNLTEMHALQLGTVHTGDAIEFMENNAQDGDLIFIDPPYSGVHYSRFYHVLETIARKELVSVSGQGRYPDFSQRPQSDFSNKSSSLEALKKMFLVLSRKKCSIIFTFPSGECSNGLSGTNVIEEAARYFSVKTIKFKNNFSTLGGNNKNRTARQKTTELILLLKNT